MTEPAKVKKIHQPLLGEEADVEFREFEGGLLACPICGFLYPIGGGFPWGMHGPSYNICPCCKCEYGCDDSGGRSLLESWEVLRRRWLDREKWSEKALAQVTDNLEIDRERLLESRKTEC